MNTRLMVLAAALALVVAGCADMPQLGGGPKYGDTAGTVASQANRNGTITALEIIQVDENYKLGISTAVGAVAGGLLGSQIGEGRGSTVGAVLGAAAGAAAGTVVESKMKKQDAQRVSVKMSTGGTVTIVQPVDGRLKSGMAVRVEGSGESARVVPR
ncbi:MAG: glycine zipper 2TM domain-containing protein [Thiobacillus sp.]